MQSINAPIMTANNPNSPNSRLGSPSVLNSMATLIFNERINVHLTLLIVLLIQKRKKESSECMQELLTTFSTELEHSNTTSFFKDNVLPLIEELYDACMTDRVTRVAYIIEQQTAPQPGRQANRVVERSEARVRESTFRNMTVTLIVKACHFCCKMQIPHRVDVSLVRHTPMFIMIKKAMCLV